MHKKDARGVAQATSSFMERQHYKNNAFNAYSAGIRLSGRHQITELGGTNIGLSSGLGKVVRSDFYAESPGTVRLNSMALKTFGSNKPHLSILITLQSGTWFTTLPISIRTGVC
jgi:hypothetical protein